MPAEQLGRASLDIHHCQLPFVIRSNAITHD